MDVESTHRAVEHDAVPPWLALPADWPSVDDALLDAAVDLSLAALSTTTANPAHRRLARYYDRAGANAASTFLDLEPKEWRNVTATDLVATSLLDVTFTPHDVRRLLEPGPSRDRVTTALCELPDALLATADTDALAAMGEFYLAVLDAVSPPERERPDRWVVASKLCARKRPDLYPIRDAGVRELFGTTEYDDHRADWQVFRHVIAHQDVIHAIDAAHQAAVSESGGNPLDVSRLRLLDVALFTYRSSPTEG
ncbi:DUF6308 family protein [Georgenia sp. MJ173]|uniref:DUF6308 family protein n=1 Tax=Georgenia sunbinii TaxID=3117728 RepID=UPI002F266AFF